MWRGGGEGEGTYSGMATPCLAVFVVRMRSEMYPTAARPKREPPPRPR